MTQAIATNEHGISAALEQVVVQGDLSKLSAADRVTYYREVCLSLGLNPLTQPFQYITLNNKLTLYVRKDGTDQLRAIRRVNLTIVGRELIEGLYIVTAEAETPDGRRDSDIGAVAIEGLKGDVRANAIMKATTKAKRRVTLSICGLGMLDETEIETIADARQVPVDMETGEILAPPTSPKSARRWAAEAVASTARQAAPAKPQTPAAGETPADPDHYDPVSGNDLTPDELPFDSRSSTVVDLQAAIESATTMAEVNQLAKDIAKTDLPREQKVALMKANGAKAHAIAETLPRRKTEQERGVTP